MSRISKTLFSVLIILLVPALAFAAPRITPNVSAAGVTWQSAPEFEGVTLVVMAPSGAFFTKDFAGGQAPSFSLKDIGGALAVDGTYTWELRYTPRVSAEVRRAITDAREKGDDAAAAQIIKDAGIAGVTQSGVFSVSGGSFVSPTLAEPARAKTQVAGPKAGSDALHAAPNDIVQADDVIIQGSLCVGLDCVVNESFGFDTIRLKENNDRIKFDDTSTSAGFPNHDWQLTANDSASGGANKFSIEDITAATVPFTVTGSAPSNSVFVDSTGRVGLRTSTPVLDLHITTTNTPAIRQEQTSGGGFTAQTWDIGANEANWFVRDVTGGSRLPLRIRPGAPTSSVDIAASGFVGIGTASPAVNLHIFSSSTADAVLGMGEDPAGSTGTESAFNFGYAGASLGRGAGFFNVRPDSNAVAPNPSIRFLIANSQKMILNNLGNLGLGVANPSNPIQHSSGALLTAGGTWTNASSRDFKFNIKNLDADAAEETVKNLKPVTFIYKADPNEHHVGFIAEDVPALVATPDRKGLSPMDIVAVLTKVVQDQQATIDQLKARLDQIEKKQ